MARKEAIEKIKEITIKDDFGAFVKSLNLSRDDYRAMMEYIDELYGLIEILPSVQPERVCVATVTLTDEQVKEVAEKAKNAVISVIEPETHWIPCSERLPYAEYGESDNVLATCGCRDVEDGSIRWIKTLYFNGGNWCYPTGETYLEKVYAWMPLPEPYRGGEKE